MKVLSLAFTVTILALEFLTVSVFVIIPRNAFTSTTPIKALSAATLITEAVNPDMTGIEEQACLDAAGRVVRTQVPIATDVHPSGQVGISYIHWPATTRRQSKLPPVVLIHGFDSNCLEFRRLGPELAARGMDLYAVDCLGWGFSQLDGGNFSAQAKVQSLLSFLNTVLDGKQYYVGGGSLGGAVAIEVASMADNDKCVGVVLIDAQGFVDGIGPMASLPTPLAKLGAGVLKNFAVRNAVTQMSYYDKEIYATKEAVTVGRIHCQQEGWDDALVSFMQSGGFSPSKKVPLIRAPALLLWGRQDGILDGEEFIPKFLTALPNATLQWIEECGHVPHIEQPEQTADAIFEFATSSSSSKSNPAIESESKYPIGLLVVGALAGSAAAAANFLPVF